MNSLKKLLIGITLLTLFVIPASLQFVSAPTNAHIGVKEETGAIKISTDYITIRIIPGQAHINWWFGNKTTADEMYKLQLVKIQEFFGSDAVLDTRNELLGGIKYNFINQDWIHEIVIGEDEITITLSLTGLANGADIQIIMHVYNTDTPISGTDQVVDALTELKFDIVVNNWDFSEGAQGLAIMTCLDEVQNRHRVQVRNGTTEENGNTTRKMLFQSDEFADVVAYFEWAEFADVYDSSLLVDTIDVSTAYFDDPGEGFSECLANVWLTFPNYGDGLKLVHDPSIGILDDAFTNNIPLYLFPIIGGIVALAIGSAIIIKKRH